MFQVKYNSNITDTKNNNIIRAESAINKKKQWIIIMLDISCMYENYHSLVF